MISGRSRSRRISSGCLRSRSESLLAFHRRFQWGRCAGRRCFGFLQLRTYAVTQPGRHAHCAQEQLRFGENRPTGYLHSDSLRQRPWPRHGGLQRWIEDHRNRAFPQRQSGPCNDTPQPRHAHHPRFLFGRCFLQPTQLHANHGEGELMICAKTHCQ